MKRGVRVMNENSGLIVENGIQEMSGLGKEEGTDVRETFH